MGFYNTKTNQYLKSVTFSHEQLEETKKKIIDVKKRYIENLKNDMHISRISGFESDYDRYKDESEAYFLSLKELDFIETMTVTDFYQYLITLENYNLCKIEDKAYTDMANNIKTMNKYKAQKGLTGKASALFGIDKKMIDKNSKQFDENNNLVEFTKDARKEWQSMTPENQAIYIIGRFEVDKKIGFDKENFESYQESLSQKETTQVSENEMER